MGVDGVVLFLGSWMECPSAMSVLREVEHLPVCLWGFPMFEHEGALTSTGSFVSYTMFKGSMDRLGFRYVTVFGMPDSSDTIAEVTRFCAAAGAMRAMKRIRLGYFGYTSMGIYTGTFDHVLMRGKIGPEVVHYDSYTLINRAHALSDDDCAEPLARLEQYKIRDDVSRDDLLKAARFAQALLDLCHKDGLDGVNIKCQYEFSKEYGFVMCVPLSLLAEYGVVSSCEGDMMCTVSMAILSLLAGAAVTYGDSINLAGDVLKLSSCGFMPFSMGIAGCQEIRKFLPHPGFSGIQCSFVQRPERVTVMRLIEDIGSYHILYFTGQGLDTQLRQGYMPALDVRFDGSGGEFLKQANGQHYAICYGDVSEEIETYAALMGIQAVRV
jgi:L-fucose isomerase-like protein